MKHTFYTRAKMGRKAKRGQTKAVRSGARHPGGGIGKKMSAGSTRHPF